MLQQELHKMCGQNKVQIMKNLVPKRLEINV